MERKLPIGKDGHVHTPYCPHTSQDVYERYAADRRDGRTERASSRAPAERYPLFEPYVRKALEKGLRELSFTEHMPFPCYFLEDRAYQDECAPQKDVMQDYFRDVRRLREAYAGRILLNAGLEVDYLDGYEEQTAQLLDEYGPSVQDALLSVHFVRLGDKLCDIDVQKGFEEAREVLGSVEAVYDRYYETLLKAVCAGLGPFKPRRIGHPNLIRIFRRLYPTAYENRGLLEELAAEIKARGYAVDADTAGLRKPYCGELYVSGFFRTLVERYGIEMVFGSDAHAPEDVGRDFEKFGAGDL